MSEDGKSHWRLYSLIVLMTLLWSANFVIAKFALREIPPLLIVGLRMILAALCMLVVYRNRPRELDRRELPSMVALGVLGIGLNQVFFVIGLARTSVAHAAVIIGLTPVTVLLLAALLKQERLNIARLAGMAVALGGVAVLQFTPQSARTHSMVGDLLVFLGSSTFAVYTVAGKTMANRLGAITVNTVAYIASAILLLPLTVWQASDFRFEGVSWLGWSSLVYMGAVSSAFCYIVYQYALSRTSASRVAAFAYVQPVAATLMAIPTLGENPTRSLVVGGALVFAGVFLAERS